MSSFITPSTDPKIADIIGMSPLMTEITLGCQTMMSSMTWGHLTTGRTGVERAFCAMVTEIRTNVAVGGGSGWHGVVYQDLGGRRGDPLSFSDLDSASTTREDVGEVGREEIRSAKGMGEGELVVCPW